ncbi:Fc.00g013540.m01.CDS01 [Cosmosporella sp. VM-42]
MTLGRILASAIGLLAVANAHPAGVEIRAGATTTTTMTQASTITQVVAAATAAAATGNGSQNDTLPGVAYAPYRADHQCKTKAQINDDFSRFKGSYGMVRIYGTDCGQVPIVCDAAKSIGVKLFLGIWDLDKVADEARMIISGVNGDWDIVNTVSVGNELVNSGQASPKKVIQAVKKARKILRKAGYKGPVVTVDTFIATLAHPELCQASDYCAINAHAFFDSTITAPQAGKWLTNTVESLRKKVPATKNIVVTESGWPTKGMTNGQAVPGLEEQQAAIDSLKEAFADNPGDLILFSAFNDLWKKKEAATFNADQYYGIGGAVSNSDH